MFLLMSARFSVNHFVRSRWVGEGVDPHETAKKALVFQLYCYINSKQNLSIFTKLLIYLLISSLSIFFANGVPLCRFEECISISEFNKTSLDKT